MSEPTKNLDLLALRLHGDDLLPETITAHIGIAPTRQLTRGRPRPGARPPHEPATIGMWSITSTVDASDLSTELTSLVSSLENLTQPLTSLPGVETAYFDIFFATETRSRADFCVDIPPETIARIHDLGAGVRVTFALIPDEITILKEIAELGLDGDSDLPENRLSDR